MSDRAKEKILMVIKELEQDVRDNPTGEVIQDKTKQINDLKEMLNAMGDNHEPME